MSSFLSDKPLKQLLAFLLIMLFSALIFTGLGTLLAYFIWGDMGFGAGIDYQNENSIKALKLIQAMSHIGIFSIPPLLFVMLLKKPLGAYFNLNTSVNTQKILMAIALFIMLLPIVSLSAVWNADMQLPSWLSGLENWMKNTEENTKILTESMLKTQSLTTLGVNLFVIAILPAIGEELLFRGLLMRSFSRIFKNIHLNIFIVSLIFSGFHMQFYGFLPRFLLGMFLGYTYYWTSNLWVPILIHFINNAMTVIIYYLVEVKFMAMPPDDMGSLENPWILVVNLIILVFGILWFQKNKKRALFT